MKREERRVRRDRISLLTLLSSLYPRGASGILLIRYRGLDWPLLLRRSILAALGGRSRRPGGGAGSRGGQGGMTMTGPRGDALLGTTIAGRYVLRAVLGQGGMATVYRADQPALEREVAVKVIAAA